ncbi:MAG: peptide-methionine (R)-S-oxide reductase MsrB [Balneolales bacterium]
MLKIRYPFYFCLILASAVVAGCQQEQTGYANAAAKEYDRSHQQTVSAMEKVTKTDDEWRGLLTASEYRILRRAGTELPYINEYYKTRVKGIYQCAACDLPVFDSETKYDSGSGWPAFYAPIEGHIITTLDTSFFMERTEVLCARCDSHLGHVFEDGPDPTGLRYCINSVAMNLEEH